MNKQERKTEKKVIELKPGMENINVTVRVIEAQAPKVIQTRRGPRTISEAIVGDETGRTKMTLWGSQAGSIEEGQALHIEGAWTTSYKGQVIINIGNRSRVEEVEEGEVPEPENIPQDTPQAPLEYKSRQPKRKYFSNRQRR